MTNSINSINLLLELHSYLKYTIIIITNKYDFKYLSISN